MVVKCVYEGYNGPTLEMGNGHMSQVQGAAGAGYVPALSGVVLLLNTDTGAQGDRTAVKQMERAGTLWKFLTPNDGVQTLKMSCNLKKLFGTGPVDTDKISHNANHNPEQMGFFHFSAARTSDDYPTSTVRIVCYFKIEYDCVFDQKIDYTDS